MSSNKDDRPRGITKNTAERRRAPWPVADSDDAKSLQVESLQGRVDSKIGFDAKGDPVLEWSLPTRRAGDNAKSFLKYLDNRALRIDEDNWLAKWKRKSTPGYNPYDKPPKR
ncbi:MAG TPA: hypothetical protein VIC71_12300 [Gammaproteobacteria bacterium]|jgi:hypothetical protein